jgi:hypothetical protein
MLYSNLMSTTPIKPEILRARFAVRDARSALQTMEHVLQYWEADEAYVDAQSVMRWRSNESVPPNDCLQAAMDMGLITLPQFTKSVEVSTEEMRQAIRAYVANQPAQPSDEELYEMRAAFGPGEVVVDVISGRRTQL